jgi:GH15 family glucan-1,4-alpha-glucosidase
MTHAAPSSDDDMQSIEQYALIGDTRTAALVGRDGSINWLCLPRFDSAACFAALLGDTENGRWRIAPQDAVRAVRRRYRRDTLVLETDFDTPEGSVRVIDFMPPGTQPPRVVRVVEGLRGQVPMHLDLRLRFDYGHTRPRLRRVDGARVAIAGPDSIWLRTPVETHDNDAALHATFVVAAGEVLPFDLSWLPSHEHAPDRIDPVGALADTESFWTDWISSCTYDGEWREAVVRSLITLKALTYAPTGAIVAAPTTSLPEQLGGVRNWDYRYCWLRDAAITLLALTRAGFRDEMQAWHSWLLRAIPGDPTDLQTLYGVAGERRLTELELPWLPGYKNSKPVRIGNDAVGQLQLDTYGEVVQAIHEARHAGLQFTGEEWTLTRALVDHVEAHWHLPDQGIWEVRGPPRHFVSSKVMAWVALDRAIKDAEQFRLPAPLSRWRALRAEIRREVLAAGYDSDRATFTQAYGSKALDASALLFPLVGFLPATDHRMRGTVAAIERDLSRDGLVYRYTTSEHAAVDGLPRGEGAFLACTFWLVANYARSDRLDEARALFERLLSLRNDLGLLAEQYDPHSGRQLGNFPQAFTHVPLIMAANLLNEDAEPGAMSVPRSLRTSPVSPPSVPMPAAPSHE